MRNVIRRSVCPGVHMTCISTDQFKTSVFSAALVLPLRTQNAPYAILPQLLYRGTRTYPTLDALNNALDTLYGARVEPYVRKVGDNLVLGFVSDVIDEAYAAQGDTLTVRVASLLGELLCRPALEDGKFREADVAGEREQLCRRIAGLKNNVVNYAVRRAIEIMYDGEPYGSCEWGTLEGAQSLTEESIRAAYEEALRGAGIELFYCGSQDPDTVTDAFTQALALPLSEERYLPELDVCRTAGRSPRTVVEEMDVAQGKLTLGLRTGCVGDDENYPALMLFNAAFGGYTGSRLFCNVRERMSLCYYASSSLNSVKGLMTVASGIENEKFDVARGEIFRQLEDLRSGGLKQDELEQARRSVIHSVRAMQDNPLALERFWQKQAIAGFAYSPEQMIEKLETVSRGQVMAVGRRLDLDLVYFLKGVAK